MAHRDEIVMLQLRQWQPSMPRPVLNSIAAYINIDVQTDDISTYQLLKLDIPGLILPKALLQSIADGVTQCGGRAGRTQLVEPVVLGSGATVLGCPGPARLTT